MSDKTVSAAPDRIVALDGLRTLAIIVVVLYHLHVPNFTGGFVGVNMFYVLSGFLITSILLREHTVTGRIRLGRFWTRRALRLYPALLVMVIVAACVWPIADTWSKANVDVWRSVTLALTYTSNIGRWLFHQSIGALDQTWSLGMEEQFYLVWPPILVLLLWLKLRKRWMLGALVVLVAASAVGGWLLYAPRSGSATPDVYFSPVLNVGPLLMGVILALLLTMERPRRILAGAIGEWSTWIGLAGLVAIDLTIRSGWQEQQAVFGIVLPLSAVSTWLLLAGIVSRRTAVSRVLSLTPVAWFGRNVSYSLYLWHVLVIAMIRPLIPGNLGKLSAFVIAVAVALASHYLVEKPFLRLKKRFEPRAPQPVEAADADERELAEARA
jgi:peptidoglycan/LPS O-acetylase OafA/YrhL